MIAAALAFAFALAVPGTASAALSLVKVGDFADPIFMTAPPGDPHRLFVVERGGTIRVVRDGVVQTTPFLDISSSVYTGGEGGLESMAFPPDYATTGRFYVFYTAPRSGDPNGDVVTIASLRRSATNPDVADPATFRTILTVDHPGFSNHNGGQLQFGPDGLLYVSVGDGGSSNDPPNNAQNTQTLLGKILRIRPTPGRTLPYALPGDNPFDGSNGSRAIWAYGLRNPYRFSFDRLTGDMVIADVGQGAREEVDWTARGTGGGFDYGWRCAEGSIPTPGVSPACTPSGTYAPPVFEYDHSAGRCAIIGGYVVRDHDLASLYGRYLYTDLCVGDIRSLALARPSVTDDQTTGLAVSSPVSFGEDSCGHVYVTTQSDEVDRIQEGTAFTPCKAPPPPPDVTPPHLGLTIAHAQRLDSARSVHAGLRCDERCHVAITGEVFVPKTGHHQAIPARRVTFAALQRARLSIAVSNKGARATRKALRKGRRVWLHLTFTGRDDHGNVRRVRRSVRLIA